MSVPVKKYGLNPVKRRTTAGRPSKTGFPELFALRSSPPLGAMDRTHSALHTCVFFWPSKFREEGQRERPRSPLITPELSLLGPLGPLS